MRDGGEGCGGVQTCIWMQTSPALEVRLAALSLFSPTAHTDDDEPPLVSDLVMDAARIAAESALRILAGDASSSSSTDTDSSAEEAWAAFRSVAAFNFIQSSPATQSYSNHIAITSQS